MILHHRYHRERDLLRRCHNGEQAARTQFANVYQPVIEGTIATTLADTEATATDEAHVANTCVAHIFIHWETVPSRTAALSFRPKQNHDRPCRRAGAGCGPPRGI